MLPCTLYHYILVLSSASKKKSAAVFGFAFLSKHKQTHANKGLFPWTRILNQKNLWKIFWKTTKNTTDISAFFITIPYWYRLSFCLGFSLFHLVCTFFSSFWNLSPKLPLFNITKGINYPFPFSGDSVGNMKKALQKQRFLF